MFTPTTTPAHALAGAGLALATGLALAAPVQAAPPIRSLGEQQVAQQVREAARTASDNRIKQRSTPPGRATPTTDALEGYHRDRKSGVREEDAQLVVIDKMIVAASSGDKRALYVPGGQRA